jgi:GTP-binding protein YchF
MSVCAGIFGLPNVGKSTCLNALSQVILAEANNYPFCTIEPNLSSVPVPDARLENLAQIVHPKQRVPAAVEFVDIAGLVKNASKGEGLGNQFLGHIRAVDALIHVVRCFDDPNVVHISGAVNPLEDIETIDTELMLADLAWLEKVQRLYQKLAKSGNKEAKLALETLEKVDQSLNQGILLRQVEWEASIQAQLKKWEFLTIKPVLYLANVSEDGFVDNPLLDSVQKKALQDNIQVIVSCVKLEADLIGASEKEKQDVLALLGEETFGLGHLIRAAYRLLGLQTFFTAGPEEVKAWTIPMGASAWEASGRIHSDIQQGFIRAEVVSYDDFITYKGVTGAKAAGKWRLKKAEEILEDGDVVYFRFNIDKKNKFSKL